MKNFKKAIIFRKAINKKHAGFELRIRHDFYKHLLQFMSASSGVRLVL